MRRGPRWSQSERGPHAHAAGASVIPKRRRPPRPCDGASVVPKRRRPPRPVYVTSGSESLDATLHLATRPEKVSLVEMPHAVLNETNLAAVGLKDFSVPDLNSHPRSPVPSAPPLCRAIRIVPLSLIPIQAHAFPRVIDALLSKEATDSVGSHSPETLCFDRAQTLLIPVRLCTPFFARVSPDITSMSLMPYWLQCTRCTVASLVPPFLCV